jgi:hypothetical protein
MTATTEPGEAVDAGAIPGPDTAAGDLDLDGPVRLHALTYLDEGDEVTVGRPDIDSYCVLPADGAALLRRLATGATPRAAAAWYEGEYGQPVDLAEFLAAMSELDFVAGAGEVPAAAAPVRWRRLGRAAFSPVAWLGYATLLGLAVAAVARHHDLVPTYRHIFFSPYITFVVIVVFLGQFPLLFLHELFHTLAGRRLGLRSTLGVSNRLYFVVFETRLDGLVTVPRRRRYLPILAGMLLDLLAVAGFTVAAALLRHPDGGQPLAGAICLALAFATLLRFGWQFYFYLQTDLYAAAVTVFGCVDLQRTARELLRNRANRLLRRRHALVDETRWHPVDRRVARWYSWLLLAGCTFSIATAVLAGVPTLWRVMSTVFGRLLGRNADGAAGLADSWLFVAINVLQFGWFGAVWAHQRRTRAGEQVRTHVI